jgi:hypothetical protein
MCRQPQYRVPFVIKTILQLILLLLCLVAGLVAAELLLSGIARLVPHV